MFAIPAAAEPLVEAVKGVFTKPTFRRFILMMTGLMVTMGRRTVSRALQTLEPFLEGHWCNYHRLYSQARFSMWRLAAVLVRQVVALLPAQVPIVLVADDTVVFKGGDRVWAKSVHRDSKRSSRTRHNMTFGHRWLVLCVLVKLPGTARPWALPVLCGLCISPKVGQKIGVRQKTAGQLAKQLLIRLMRWFPNRKFILVGDSMVVRHETVGFAQKHAHQVTVIGRLRADASFYTPPPNPKRRCRGGLVKKGRRTAPPAERVNQLHVRLQLVAWYGGESQEVHYVTETALWYDKHQARVTPIRWVGVLGNPQQGQLETAYFYSSDPAMEADRIIELYISRWNIEVTFEEVRALLGLESTRHWCRQSVLRVVPLIFGLFTAVSLIWSHLARQRPQWERLTQTPCYRKSTLSFADVLYLVRRELWENGLLRHHSYDQCLTALPRELQTMLLTHLAAAA